MLSAVSHGAWTELTAASLTDGGAPNPESVHATLRRWGSRGWWGLRVTLRCALRSLLPAWCPGLHRPSACSGPGGGQNPLVPECPLRTPGTLRRFWVVELAVNRWQIYCELLFIKAALHPSTVARPVS